VLGEGGGGGGGKSTAESGCKGKHVMLLMLCSLSGVCNAAITAVGVVAHVDQ
jgi:hypothetical protein